MINYSFKNIPYTSNIDIIPDVDNPNIYIKILGSTVITLNYLKDIFGNIKIKRDSQLQEITINGIKLDGLHKTDIMITYIDVMGKIEFYYSSILELSTVVSNNPSIPTTPDKPPVIVTVPPVITVPTSGTGNILWEMWKNIPITSEPSLKKTLTSFNAPTGQGNSYKARIRGYIVAPQTGNYTFYIACDDFGKLLLSSDTKTSGAVQIASVPDWVPAGDYLKYPSQTSKLIPLIIGQKYYIEAWMEQGGGGDNLSVAWKLPDGTFEKPIDGKNLIPY